MYRIIALLTAGFAPLIAGAQDAEPLVGDKLKTEHATQFGKFTGALGLTGDLSLEQVAGSILFFFLGALGIVFLGLTVYGGYVWMMAQGNDEEVKKSKMLIRNSIIGLAIVFGAAALTGFVLSKLGAATDLK